VYKILVRSHFSGMGGVRMFEMEYEKFLQQQRELARGQRLVMLNRDLSGTKKLLEVVVWPVLKSFQGVILEYEFLDKQSDACRRSFYELLGRYTSIAGSRAMDELTVYEREVIRYSFSLHRDIRDIPTRFFLSGTRTNLHDPGPLRISHGLCIGLA
jgi:hypothetical protein